MKHFSLLFVLVSMLYSCSTAKLTSTLNTQPANSTLVALYRLPKKMMQVTATYTVQQQKRFRKLSVAELTRNRRAGLRKGHKYNPVPFDYFVVTVDGDVNLKYWLEDDGNTAASFYYLTSDKKRGLTSTDVTYVEGTHILKSLNSSLTPAANEITVSALKFASAIASTGLGLAPGLDAQGIVTIPAAKTDSAVVVESKTIPLMQLVDVTASLFKGKTEPVVVAEFNTTSLHSQHLIPDSVKAPSVQVSLSPSLASAITTSATTTGQSAAQPTGTTLAKADGIVYRAVFPCTVLVTVTSYKPEDNSTSTQLSASRVSFPQLSAAEATPITYWQGIFDGKQSVNISLNPTDGGLLTVSHSRESKEVSTVLDQLSSSVQTTVDAYEKQKTQNSELQRLKDKNDLLDAQINNKKKQKEKDTLDAGN